MDGWMDGWLDGWMDGWMDGWIGWIEFDALSAIVGSIGPQNKNKISVHNYCIHLQTKE